MAVSKEYLLSLLPAYRDEWTTVTADQDVTDIIKEILKSHNDFAQYYDLIGPLFIGSSLTETCSNLVTFCKKNIRYKEESEDSQSTAVPQGILQRGYGDCKHYASFIGGCLGAIERYTGEKIDWRYAFASYKWLQPDPYHVFVIVYMDGVPHYLDPTPGADNATPIFLYEKEIKKRSMALIKNISGTDTATSAQVLLNRIAKDGAYTKGVIPTAIPVPVIPQVNTIGALSDTDKIFVGAGLVGLSMFLIKGKTFGAINKKKLLVPGLILAAGVGYYGYTKGWFGKKSIPPGATIVLDSDTHASYAQKVSTHAGAWASGSGVYADVLTTGLPDYAAIINSMTLDEQMSLYSLVNDNPNSGFSSGAAQYPVLIAMLSKYDLPFIVAA